MSETSGKRTFFHNPGANALFHQTELNRAYAGYQHLHYGYLNLLGKMDLVYEGETGTAQLLKSAQLLGLTTSIDLVSSQSSHYAETVIASLPYTNLLFCNEIELGQLLNLKEIKRDATSAKSYYQRLFNLGFSEALILHTKTWAFYIDRESYYLQPALQVAQGSIKSNSGAGDAFAAGFLFDYLKDFKPELALLKATYAAATCLTAITCSNGVQPFSQAVQTLSTFIFHND